MRLVGAISRHSLLLASEKLSAKHLSLLFLTLTMIVAWTEDAMPVLDYASFFLMVESRLRIAWSCLPQKPQNFVSIFGFFFCCALTKRMQQWHLFQKFARCPIYMQSRGVAYLLVQVLQYLLYCFWLLVSAYYRPCLVPKNFSTVPVTSNIWRHMHEALNIVKK